MDQRLLMRISFCLNDDFLNRINVSLLSLAANEIVGLRRCRLRVEGWDELLEKLIRSSDLIDPVVDVPKSSFNLK